MKGSDNLEDASRAIPSDDMLVLNKSDYLAPDAVAVLFQNPQEEVGAEILIIFPARMRFQNVGLVAKTASHVNGLFDPAACRDALKSEKAECLTLQPATNHQ
jgi:hypothetical protein